MEKYKRSLATYGLFIIATLSFLCGSYLASVSYLPSSLSAAVKYSAYFGGSPDFAMSKKMIFALRAGGILFILSALLSLAARKRIEDFSIILFDSLSDFFEDIRQAFYGSLKGEERSYILALFAITILGALLRVSFLFQPIRYDEAFSFVAFASQPLFVGLVHYAEPNNHLFHTFLVHIAFSLIGSELWIIRLPAFFAGVLIVPASYIVIRNFYNSRAALFTASLVASSSFLIEYSALSRGYTIVVLLFLSILGLTEYLLRKENFGVWALFCASSAIGFYTIPIMLYPFGVVIVWLLLDALLTKNGGQRSAFFKKVSLSCIITALLTAILYLPVLAISGVESVVANRFVASHTLGYFFKNFPASAATTWEQWSRDIPFTITILLAAGFLASIIFHRRLACHKISLAVAAGLWILPLLIIQRVVPFERVWIFLLPIYIGMAVTGFIYLLDIVMPKFSLKRPAINAFVALAVTLLLGANVVRTQSVWFSDESGSFRDAEEITFFLKDILRPGDRVYALEPANAPLEYYFRYHLGPSSPTFLNRRLSVSNRVLTVVKEGYEGQLEKTYAKFKGRFAPPKVLKKFESSSLYESPRLN